VLRLPHVELRENSLSFVVLPRSAAAELSPLSLHDALPIYRVGLPQMRGDRKPQGGRLVHDRRKELRRDLRVDLHQVRPGDHGRGDRKSTRLNSSHVSTSYAAFCLKKKRKFCFGSSPSSPAD